MGGRPRRGLLFEGGPGTGKTHTAKAMAAEAGVPFLYASATSFQSSYQAATSRKVRAYFRALRTAARKEGGAIGFIDEFDAIAAARSGMAMSSAPASAMSGPTCCGGLEGLPGAPVRSLAGGSSVTTAFVGGGDLQAAVNELLVQMQSFDEGSWGERLTGKVVSAVNLFLPAHRQLAQRPTRHANVLVIAATNRPTRWTRLCCARAASTGA
jgi:SpoVK/Ycf46/Vps4 family AAA+-type ATPase